MILMDHETMQDIAKMALALGADAFEGKLTYSPTEGLLVGDTDVGEYLNHFNGEKVMIIFGELGEADEEPEDI